MTTLSWRRVMGEASVGRFTACELRDRLDIWIAGTTMLRFLSCNAHFMFKKGARAPIITAMHRNSRLEWARQLVMWDNVKFCSQTRSSSVLTAPMAFTVTGMTYGVLLSFSHGINEAAAVSCFGGLSQGSGGLNWCACMVVRQRKFSWISWRSICRPMPMTIYPFRVFTNKRTRQSMSVVQLGTGKLGYKILVHKWPKLQLTRLSYIFLRQCVSVICGTEMSPYSSAIWSLECNTPIPDVHKCNCVTAFQ